VYTGYLGQADERLKEKDALLTVLEGELNANKREMDKLYQLYLDDGITAEGFRAKYRPLEERQQQLASELPKSQAEIDLMRINLLSSQEVISEAKDLYSRWPSLAREEQRSIIEAITERITVGKDHIDISLNYLPSAALHAAGNSIPFVNESIKATRPVNRVAALGYAAAELLAFGKTYMAQIVANVQALARALQERGIPCLAAHKGFTRSHQAIADVRRWGGGYAAANRLQEANIIVNKNLIPGDRPEDWDRPSGIRIGTIEVTRLGMGPAEMAAIAEFMHDLLVKGRKPEEMRKRVIEFRRGFQTLYYCFENGLPNQS